MAVINSSVLPTSALPAALPSTIMALSIVTALPLSLTIIFPEAPTVIAATSNSAIEGVATEADTLFVAKFPKSTLMVWFAFAPI